MEWIILIFRKLIYIFLFLFSFSVQSEKLIIGKAKILDGDTLKINYNKVRLHGIDAPEIKQTCKINNKNWNCGIESSNALKRLILEKQINCKIVDVDIYKRDIGVCFVNEININQYMVRNGWAIAYRYYSHDYIKEENLAKSEKIGIWQGQFIEPYTFRKLNK